MFTSFRMIVESFAIRSGISSRQRGATMMEYALIVAIISLAVIVVAATLPGLLEGVFTDANTALTTATTP